MSSMNISCFGAAREIAGGSTIVMEGLDGRTVGYLRQRLVAAYPSLGELVSFAIARNEVYALDSDTIEAGDDLVIIPPVSGG